MMAKHNSAPYIVALSASEPNRELFVQCRDAGFDDFFRHPLQFKELEEQVI